MTKYVPIERAVWFAVVVFAGCFPSDEFGDSRKRRQLVTTPTINRESLLANMPLNNGQRCSGVCLAIKMLLAGECLGEGCDDPVELGRKIFAMANSRGTLRYRPRLRIDGVEHPIDARESLDRLGAVVTDLYRARFTELAQSAEGRERLRTAATSFVTSEMELNEILKAASEQIEMFCGLGDREFDDGSLKDTNHAFFIRLLPEGTRVVYDPNDPGHPIPCRLCHEENRLIVEWTCQFRDAKVRTNQSYYIVSREAYFRELVGQR